MDRAYVICHMAVSLDGKIDGDFSSRWQCIVSLYRSLIIAMIGGRYMGDGTGCNAWNDRKCVHMADVYGGCIFECSSGDHSPACVYPCAHGGFE